MEGIAPNPLFTIPKEHCPTEEVKVPISFYGTVAQLNVLNYPAYLGELTISTNGEARVTKLMYWDLNATPNRIYNCLAFQIGYEAKHNDKGETK
jgi:hypothetical protein